MYVFRKWSWDKAGILLSSLCAVHCLLFPIVLALMPLSVLGVELHQWAHPVLFALIIPTVVLAVRNSNSNRSIILLVAGVGMLALAWPVEYWVGSTAEAGTTLMASALLIVGHWYNYTAQPVQSCKIYKMEEYQTEDPAKPTDAM